MEANVPEPETPIEWARHYADRGHPVFPLYEIVTNGNGTLRCACGKADCKDAGKHPRTAHGFHDATTNQDQIRRWWFQWPNANTGLRTGDGLLVLDVDVDKGGDDSLEILERKYGKLPTRQALTGSGGQHRWFLLPDAVKVSCSNNFDDGLDIRSDGGYVVVEPSIHKTGNIYRWDGLLGFEEPVAAIPEWLFNILTAKHDKTCGGEAWRQIEIQVNPHPELAAELVDYIEADSELSALWNLRRSDLADAKTGRPNFSRYDMGLSAHFVKAGLLHQQVADIITVFRLKHGNPKGKGSRLDYLKRTIWTAAQGASGPLPIDDHERDGEHEDETTGAATPSSAERTYNAIEMASDAPMPPEARNGQPTAAAEPRSAAEDQQAGTGAPSGFGDAPRRADENLPPKPTEGPRPASEQAEREHLAAHPHSADSGLLVPN